MKWKSLAFILIIFSLLFSKIEEKPFIMDIQAENQFQRLTDYKIKVWIDQINWTPDGKELIYRLTIHEGEESIRKVVKYNLENRKETVLLIGEKMKPFLKDYDKKYFERCGFNGMRISPSGNKILFYYRSCPEVTITDTKCRNIERLNIIPEKWALKEHIGPDHVVWSHDERKLIFSSFYCDQFSGVAVYDIDKRKTKRIFDSPTYNYVYGELTLNYKYKDFYIVSRQGKTTDLLLLHPVRHSFVRAIKTKYSNLIVKDLDDKGENILSYGLFFKKIKEYFGKEGIMIFRYNLNSKKLYLLTSPTKEREEYYSPRFSPDCKRIAFFAKDSDGKGNLWLLELKK
jgi:hypothetical protein